MKRTDAHNNPTAFTTAIAKQAGLKLGTEYEVGAPFTVGKLVLRTAKLLGDPIALTSRVLDQVGFYTGRGAQRWDYIALPDFVWMNLSVVDRRRVIGFMYKREGGTAMKGLFLEPGSSPAARRRAVRRA